MSRSLHRCAEDVVLGAARIRQAHMSAYDDSGIAEGIVGVKKAPAGDLSVPQVFYDKGRGIVMRHLGGADAGREIVIDPVSLRVAGKDAVTAGEMQRAGEEGLRSRHEFVYPLAITPVGNYAINVQWSDGTRHPARPRAALRSLRHSLLFTRLRARSGDLHA